MYRITTAMGESFLTEKANYIRVNRKNGVYVLTDDARAEGVVYHGTPYLFEDGALCYEVDTGEDLTNTQQSVVDADAMNVDQEYRLTLLELGIAE